MAMNLKIVKDSLDSKEYDKVRLFFDDTKYEDVNDKMKNGYISLKLRYLISMNNIHLILDILDEYKLMKRDYILIITHFYNFDRNLCFDIFKNDVLPNFKLENSDIDKLLEFKCYDIFYLLDDYFVGCNYKNISNNNTNITSYNNGKFRKYYIDMNIKQKIFEFYKDKLSDKYFKRLLSKIHDIDCIVDGGNISHVNNGKCDYKYVENISKNISKKYNNPLYIFHNRHKKKLKLFLETVNHFITPVNEYDDNYIIIAMILSDKPIITNDCFRDHIFDMFKNFETIDFKIKNYIIENTINYTKTSISKFKNYSKCIQVIENKIYIPTDIGMYKVLI